MNGREALTWWVWVIWHKWIHRRWVYFVPANDTCTWHRNIRIQLIGRWKFLALCK